MALRIWNRPAPGVSSKKVVRPQAIERKKEKPILGKGKKPRCCLCSKPMSPGGIVVEERPTAEDGSMQKWFYCLGCWVELRKLREPPEGLERFTASSDQ